MPQNHYISRNISKIMAKKVKQGRPAGPKKVPVNIFMTEDRRDRLKNLSVKEQKTQSILVENSLQATYGI